MALKAARWRPAWRVLAALAGGYAFCWGLMALINTGGHALGLPFHDAEHLGALLGLLLYLVVFLWAFAARSLWRVWAVLGGGGALMAGAASLLQSRLVA
ncbi:MAG: iron uptake protein [Ottowia sp.]|uniref:iron uptake protein n=1 Tax=Ottowia sp. TaxID=1898956 RepID=UPI0039E6A72F